MPARATASSRPRPTTPPPSKEDLAITREFTRVARKCVQLKENDETTAVFLNTRKVRGLCTRYGRLIAEAVGIPEAKLARGSLCLKSAAITKTYLGVLMWWDEHRR
jgi:hypothetical protein